MRTLLQDLRYGASMLMKKLGFTIVVVLTLPLTGAAMLAGYLPARRAMKVDLMVALRCE